MLDPDKFARVVERSGLSMRELGIIYGVTRQTLHNWRNGRWPTHPLIVETAAARTDGLLAAINRGVLPMRDTISREQRRRRVAAMARTLSGAK